MKRLNLDREKYHKFLTEVIDKEYQLEKEQKPNNLIICKFKKPGEKKAQINIYENNDGTTTIFHDCGKNKELSKQVAEKLVQISKV